MAYAVEVDPYRKNFKGVNTQAKGLISYLYESYGFAYAAPSTKYSKTLNKRASKLFYCHRIIHFSFYYLSPVKKDGKPQFCCQKLQNFD
jgi:hypothetical protein